MPYQAEMGMKKAPYVVHAPPDTVGVRSPSAWSEASECLSFGMVRSVRTLSIRF